MHTWIDAAVLKQTKKKDERLVACAAAGLPFLLRAGLEVALVPPVLDMPRRVHVKMLVPLSDLCAVVSFDEVADARGADALTGCHCLIKRCDIDLSSREAHARADHLLGFRVVDIHEGPVGIVCAVENLPFQTLLQVRRDDGAPDAKRTCACASGIASAAASKVASQAASEAVSETLSADASVCEKTSFVSVPYVEDFIVSIDEVSCVLTLDCPNGLFDL